MGEEGRWAVCHNMVGAIVLSLSLPSASVVVIFMWPNSTRVELIVDCLYLNQ